MNAEITDGETEVMELLGKAWDKFILLKSEHSDDINDFNYAIHLAQNIVLSRVGLRLLRLKGEGIKKI